MDLSEVYFHSAIFGTKYNDACGPLAVKLTEADGGVINAEIFTFDWDQESLKAKLYIVTDKKTFDNTSHELLLSVGYENFSKVGSSPGATKAIKIKIEAPCDRTTMTVVPRVDV